MKAKPPLRRRLVPPLPKRVLQALVGRALTQTRTHQGATLVDPVAVPRGTHLVGPLLEAVREDLTTLQAALGQALERGDATRADRAAHSLKGLGMALQGSNLQAQAKDVQSRIQAGLPWDAEVQRLLRALTAFLAALPASPPPDAQPPRQPSDPSRARDLLQSLAAGLGRRSLSSRQDVSELLGLLGPEPDLVRIKTALDRLDFRGATEALADLNRNLGHSR